MNALSPPSRMLRAALFIAALASRSGATPPEDGAQEESANAPLPPPPLDELRAKAPQPSFDAGLLLAVCGVGEKRAWERTRFCLGGLADVIAGRQKESDPGAGGYLQVATAGFRDVRVSLGFSGIVSLVDWFTLSGRAGGLVRAGPGGAAPGAEGYLEFGHRSVSLKSRYGMGHALFGGLAWVAPVARESAQTTIWVGLRIDGVWLTAPRFLF